MTITASDIPGILERHRKWVRGEEGGRRAYLQGADLQGAYLRGADLQGADLRGADLRSAYLQGADLQGADLRSAYLQGADLRSADLRSAYLQGAYLQGAYLQGADLQGADLQGADLQGAVYAFASVSFLGHGECGRTLTAIRRNEGDAPILQCGCFYGNQTELREYIANGDAKYRKTRTLALETVLALLDTRNDE